MLRQWISRRSRWIHFALAVFTSAFVAFYVNVLTSFFLHDVYSTLPTISIVALMGWWNLLAPAVLISLASQYYVGRLHDSNIRDVKRVLIEKILEAATKSLIYPNDHYRVHIRAIVTLYDPRRHKRYTRYSYNTDPDPERLGEFPAEFGVTGRAFMTRQVVVEELQSDHHANYPDAIRRVVLPDVCTILAAPIFANVDQKETPLGILAFDSILPMSKLRFDKREVRGIAQMWADILGLILRAAPEEKI